MRTIQISLIIIASLIGASLSYIRCPDNTYCPDANQCCAAKGYYTCCPLRAQCTPGGLICKYSNFIASISANEVTLDSAKPTETLPFSVTPKDYLTIADSFLETVKVYEYFPKTSACGKNLSVLLPDVLELIEKIKKVKKIEEIIPIAISVVTDLYPKAKAIIDECHGVPEELKEKIGNIIAIVKKEGWIKSVIENAKKRFAEIFINVNSAREMFEYGNYKQCGRNAGLAVAILLNID